ncbi:hypothetical protein SAMN05421678_12066 [Actinopolymorpha cephalotaxi]|uniref:Uncharacterized protein n=1 Tax=Actinopolymorpha cephalotaxi TaxID=504797 RepID=A0A1I3AT36_9ACTN|nr:hypothetical protein [Actinopolymorpha cephalotaxi]NYH86054.1 hypothetical protein [Actinopolymorpha cephalotaxi]SFH53173.1 hypothetical protein SAMN05421678_12066 [Actinopolymorpha cephalotaxi]
MPQDKHAADGRRPEHSTDGIKPSEIDQAVRAQAHHLLRQGDRRLEEMGYLDPDHPNGHRNQGAGAHCRPADGHHPTRPGSDGDTDPDR